MTSLWVGSLVLNNAQSVLSLSIVGSLREVACSASDLQGFNFCVLCLEGSVISLISPHLARFSLYVHKSGLKPDSLFFSDQPMPKCQLNETITVNNAGVVQQQQQN